MQQLQIHEYLALLDEGTDAQPIDDSLSRLYLEQAEAVWPELQTAAWEDRERRVEYVVRCRASGRLLVHVSADWKDCFLILVVPAGQVQAEAFLLFDIGAEYRPVRFICPAFEVDDIADEETISRCLPQLDGAHDPFAILESGNGTYMQARAVGGAFIVEHQLVSLSSHYRLEERVSSDVVVSLFLSYAFGRKEWACDFKWDPMEL
jgi:hypothetical protein